MDEEVADVGRRTSPQTSELSLRASAQIEWGCGYNEAQRVMVPEGPLRIARPFTAGA